MPAFPPSLSQRPPITIAIISEGGVVPAMACQRGRQADIKATQLQRGDFFSPTLPSHLLFLLSSLSHSLDFLPQQRKISSTTWRLCRPAGRQAGEAQTTCMQLGLAWRGGEQKALKDRTGQSQTDGRTGLLSPLSYLSLEAGRAAGRESAV